MTKGSTAEHQKLVSDIIFHYGSRHDFRLWPRVVGLGMLSQSKRLIKFGIKGESDIDGIFLFRGLGVRVHIEVKTGGARQSRDQKAFEMMIKKFGGIYIVARSIEDVYTGVQNWIAEYDARKVI